MPRQPRALNLTWATGSDDTTVDPPTGASTQKQAAASPNIAARKRVRIPAAGGIISQGPRLLLKSRPPKTTIAPVPVLKRILENEKHNNSSIRRGGGRTNVKHTQHKIRRDGQRIFAPSRNMQHHQEKPRG